MIKAIVFDYFGVLSSDEYWGYVGVDKLGESAFHNLAARVNLGSLGWREFIGEVARQADKPAEEVKKLYETNRLNASLLAFVSELHQHYKTGLLSNAHHDYLEHRLEEAHLQRLFDVIVVSSRVSLIKPDSRIYRLTLTKLGVAPEEAVMVDDNQYQVDGATAVGMHGILYRDLAQLKKELGIILSDA